MFYGFSVRSRSKYFKVSDITRKIFDIGRALWITLAFFMQVAGVLLLSQQLAMCGRDLHSVVNYTVRFLMDSMASFIVKKGGWVSFISITVSEKLMSDQILHTHCL